MRDELTRTVSFFQGFLCFRGQGLIPSPPALVFAIVFDLKRFAQWDPMIQQVTLVKEFEKDMLLLRVELKGYPLSFSWNLNCRVSLPPFLRTFPLSPRDICLIFGYRLYEDGTYIVAFRSVFSPLVPEVRDLFS